MTVLNSPWDKAGSQRGLGLPVICAAFFEGERRAQNKLVCFKLHISSVSLQAMQVVYCFKYGTLRKAEFIANAACSLHLYMVGLVD